MKAKKLNSSFHLLLFLIFICSGSLIAVVFLQYNPSTNSYVIVPKSSADEITITTPENKSYMEPMSGYYPGTYGFENDADGVDPEEWVDLSGAGSDAQVISNFLGHNKVLRGYDGGGSSWKIDNDITAKEGTIELWWAVSSVTGGDSHQVNIREAIDEVLFSVGCIDGQIRVLTSGDWYEIPGLTTTANTWDHVRIDFRSNSGSSYQGLNTNEFKLYYNGVDKGTYSFNKTGDSNIFRIYSGSVPSGHYGYFDAIGYSWDLGYSIGDNLEEGLLLSFDTSFSSDWLGYSLDGATNKTILGNTTITFPNEGVHDIQVFGNDTMGTEYQSSVRSFSTYRIYINTPDNKIYTEPMSGYYPGTYGFENDADGVDPEEWVDLSGAGSDAQVISNFLGHNKVLRGYDGGGSSWKIDNDITAREGTIELWWAVSSIAGVDSHQVNIREAVDEVLFAVQCSGGQIRVLTSGAWYDISGLITAANTWDHVRIDFRSNSGSSYQGLNTNEFKLYYNGVDIGTYSFNKTGDSNIFRIYSGSVPSGHYGYFDAIGYSWDLGYSIGDNLEEGLLLSFDTSFSSDWLGYSLDGATNKTILGNTTITFPNEGVHDIQVFGNNTIGTMYESNLRYFTIDAIPSTSPNIPGYNLLIIIGIISIIGIGLIRKKKKI